MNNNARNHHFLPQAYLKGFTLKGSKQSQLNVFDIIENKKFKTSPRNIGAKRDFNRIKGSKPNLVESALSPFEGEVARVINWVNKESRLPKDNDFAILMNFIALLGVRNPKTRNVIQQANAKVLKMIGQMMIEKKDVWERNTKAMKDEGYILPDIPYETMVDFIKNDEYDIEFEHGYFLQMELQSIETVLPYLFGRKWALLIIHDGEKNFVCSDQPLAIRATIPELKNGPLGFGMTKTAVILPLNRRLALYGTFEGEDMVIHANAELIAEINSYTIKNAERFIYSSFEDFDYYSENSIKNSSSLVK